MTELLMHLLVTNLFAIGSFVLLLLLLLMPVESRSVGGVGEQRARERGDLQRGRVGVGGEHQAVRAQRAHEHRVRALRVRRAHGLEDLPHVVAARARKVAWVGFALLYL